MYKGYTLKRCLYLLFAGLTDVDDVGEEVVVFSLGHSLAELCRVLEHADQDLQTVEVRVLRRDHLKNGLLKGNRKETVCVLCSTVYYNHL